MEILRVGFDLSHTLLIGLFDILAIEDPLIILRIFDLKGRGQTKLFSHFEGITPFF